MKLKLIATAMIAAGFTLAGCASHRESNASAGESRSATQFASDAALTTKVKAAPAPLPLGAFRPRNGPGQVRRPGRER